MQSLCNALLKGSRQVLRLRSLFPLYLTALLIGLLQTWPLGVAAARGALHNPFLTQLAGGGGDVIANLFLGSASVALGAGLWGLALAPLAGLFGLAYNFFSGGLLGVWSERRGFWAGCRRTFWAFTTLGLLLAVGTALVAVASALLMRLVGFVAGLIAGFMLIELLNLVGEYARAMAVLRERRNPFVLVGLAAAFCVRRSRGVLVLGLLGQLLHLAVAALYVAIAGLLGSSPPIVLWQQLAILAWIAVKLLRLAWALSYIQALGPSGLAPPVSASPAVTAPG